MKPLELIKECHSSTYWVGQMVELIKNDIDIIRMDVERKVTDLLFKNMMQMHLNGLETKINELDVLRKKQAIALLRVDEDVFMQRKARAYEEQQKLLSELTMGRGTSNE